MHFRTVPFFEIASRPERPLAALHYLPQARVAQLTKERAQHERSLVRLRTRLTNIDVELAALARSTARG